MQEILFNLTRENLGTFKRKGPGQGEAVSGQAKKGELRWFIYELIRTDNNASFYVGCTKDVFVRMKMHWSNPTAAMYKYLRAVRAARAAVKIIIHESNPVYADALRIETQLINSRDGLLNKTGKYFVHWASRGNRYDETILL